MTGFARTLIPLGLVGLVGPLAAQTSGLPLRHPGVRTGIELGLDLGLARIGEPAPLDDQTVRAVGGTVAAGLGPLGGSLTLARADRNAANLDRTTVTAAAGLRVFGGPLVPFSVTWQAAATVPVGEIEAPQDAPSERPWRGSLGIGAAATIPLPVVGITPWIAPRVEYFGRQPVSGSRVKGAVAAGVELGFLNGLVVRAAYDSRVGWEPAHEAPAGISFGIGYRLR